MLLLDWQVILDESLMSLHLDLILKQLVTFVLSLWVMQCSGIGAEVAKMEVPLGFREMPPEDTAALVLVDRCFDLVAPLHHADTLMDRIVEAIEATSSHSNGITRSHLTQCTLIKSLMQTVGSQHKAGNTGR